MSASKPQGLLHGIRVLDLSVVGPATRCTRVLADYGADVVKVTAPPKHHGGAPMPLAHHAYSGARGFRFARIDLKADAGTETFLRLATQADVILESFRPGVVDRLGIGYDAVAAVNPGIVYCSTSGYGQDGPHAQRAGHDLNYLAVGGFLHTSGRDADGRPALPGATVADIAAGGLHAATAILAALVHRAGSGTGTYLDVAVADGVVWMLSLYIDEYLATGEIPGPGHNILTGRYACYGVYRARDGGWLAVAAIEPVFWANLCRALGLERWVSHQTDDAAQDAIRTDLQAALARRDRDEWVAELADADTCVTAVADIPEVTTNRQFTSRGALTEGKHPHHGAFQQLGPLLAGTIGQSAYELPDQSATATEELLAEAGHTQNQIEALQRQGVIG